jgi:voltage-gated sodium channel
VFLQDKKLADSLHFITDNKIFKTFVIFIIVISSLLIGVKSHDLSDNTITIIGYLDSGITYFFVIEVLLRFFSYKNKKEFFKSGWNIFDTIIVGGSLIPMAGSDMVMMGRLLRIFRVLRLVTYIPELKILINTLISAIPKMGYVALLMFIIFYIYASFGNIFFEDINSHLWGDVSISLLTLFRIATFEDWTDVMYETMVVYPFSWIYYITFIFLGSFVFLNMMVGIVIDSFSQERASNKNEQDKNLYENIERNPFCEKDCELKKQIQELDNKIEVLINHRRQ